MNQPPLFQPDSDHALRSIRACPVYTPTPVHQIAGQGVSLLIKDESQRMRLGSFKALGGVYAISQLLIDRLEQQNGTRPGIEELLQEDLRRQIASETFICASAGNHGLSVAAGARLFGARARIHLSKQVPPGFADRLKQLGAEVRISGDNYEESLLAAGQDASDSSATLLADGSWPGYTDPPAKVMEGYTIMARELQQRFAQTGHWPDVVYLQAGVGGMAAAVTHTIRQTFEHQPRIVIVEPEAATCLAQSANAGQRVEATGPVSIMGRLDCKEASLLAFDTLMRCDVEYLAVSDSESEKAVEALKAHQLHTTPSGAAGYAGLLKDRDTRGPQDAQAQETALVIMSEGPV